MANLAIPTDVGSVFQSKETIHLATKKERDAAKKRSEAAKKAAATRKRQAEEEAAAAARTNTDGANASSSDDNDGSQPLERIRGEEPPEAAPPYRPQHQPLEAAGLDQHAAEEARQEELQAERDVHNERTGDASLA